MHRLSGPVWLVGIVAVVLLITAAALRSIPTGDLTLAREAIAPYSTTVNPRILAGLGALVVAGLLLLLFVYRRRIYILLWIAGWLVTAGSMFLAGHQYVGAQATRMAYGMSQFLGIVSALLFVLSADSYRSRIRIRRGYVMLLLPVVLWFGLAPIVLGPSVVFAPGHLLMAGGFAAAGVAHLMLLRQARMLGAAVIGIALFAIGASNAWLALEVPAPDAPGAADALLTSLVLYVGCALGMQLMTFEDMTYELRRTNRRLESAQSKLRRMVITDPLTGCHNRRFFEEIIGREINRRRRYGIPLSLVFIDVNHFKAVNDTLGHDAGDRVLQEVASFLLSRVREADYVFRWGGDEFLILLSCHEPEARRRALALQTAFVDVREASSLPAGLGLSVGCAEVQNDTEDVMALVKMADERMYENKRITRQPKARAAG